MTVVRLDLKVSIRRVRSLFKQRQIAASVPETNSVTAAHSSIRQTSVASFTIVSKTKSGGSCLICVESLPGGSPVGCQVWAQAGCRVAVQTAFEFAGLLLWGGSSPEVLDYGVVHVAQGW